MLTLKCPCWLNYVWHSLWVLLQDFPCTQSLQGSDLQLHSFPILVGKLASSSFLTTRIIQLAYSRMSLQKQGMNIAHNELLCCTTISEIISRKSDILSKMTVHQISHSGSPISHQQHRQRQITVLFQNTAILFELELLLLLRQYQSSRRNLPTTKGKGATSWFNLANLVRPCRNVQRLNRSKLPLASDFQTVSGYPWMLFAPGTRLSMGSTWLVDLRQPSPSTAKLGP